MAENATAKDPEILKLQRDSQEKQRDYYRDRTQQIFSWASSLMVGGIAGLFAITAGRGWSVAWPPDFGLRNDLVGLTIAVFVGYSIWWITGYSGKKDVAQENIDCLDQQLAEAKKTKLEPLKPLVSVIHGSDRVCLALLGAATIIFIFLVHVNP